MNGNMFLSSFSPKMLVPFFDILVSSSLLLTKLTFCEAAEEEIETMTEQHSPDFVTRVDRPLGKIITEFSTV